MLQNRYKVASCFRHSIYNWPYAPRELVTVRNQARVSCRPFFLNNKILTVACLYILEMLLFVRDFPNMFQTNDNVHSINTRSSNKLHLTHHRLKLMDNDPINMGVKLYNKLPDNLKNINSRTLFKHQIKSFLTDHCFYSVTEFLTY